MPEVRLIDANAAADTIMHGVEIHADEIGIGGVAIMIAFARAMRDETDFPTIEAEPVRHGHWTDNGEDKFICSACKGYVYRWFGKSDFCPRCGADMREEGADNAE